MAQNTAAPKTQNRTSLIGLGGWPSLMSVNVRSSPFQWPNDARAREFHRLNLPLTLAIHASTSWSVLRGLAFGGDHGVQIGNHFPQIGSELVKCLALLRVGGQIPYQLTLGCFSQVMLAFRVEVLHPHQTSLTIPSSVRAGLE